MPYILRRKVFEEMTEEAIPIYDKYFDELQIEEIDDLMTIAERKDNELIDHEEVMKMFGDES